MINITIKKDNFAYITTDNQNLFDLLIRSFTREVREFNNFYRIWETKQKQAYKMFMRDGGERELQIKAGLIPYLCHSLNMNRIKFNIVNERRSIKGEFKDVVRCLNDEITLRTYQEEAAMAILSTGFGCIQLPTSAGKTEVAASVMRTYFQKHPNDTIMYVVPTVMLKSEAKDRFISYGLKVNDDFPVKEGYVNILTYAALSRADNNKFGYKERDKIDAILWDEAHRLSAPKAQKLIHKFKNICMSVGISATPSDGSSRKYLLKDLSYKDMEVFGCTGRILYSVSIQDTIDKAYVTGIEVHVIEHETRHKLYDDENDWHVVKNVILKDKERAEFVAKYIKQFFTEHNMHTALCYIPEIGWSHIYMTEVAKIFEDQKDVRILELYGGGAVHEHINGEFVKLSGEQAKKAIEDIRSGEVKTIFSGTSFIREGINITSIQALFNIGGNKGTILIKQIVGRAMRKFQDKNIAYICEVSESNNPILIAQLRKKLEIYESEYNAKIVYDNIE